MKILVLAPQWPYPPRQGAAIRNLHLLRYLAERHEVTLLTFADEQSGDSGAGIVGLHRAELFTTPARSSMLRLRQMLTSSSPDMAWRLYSRPLMSRVTDLCREERFDAVHVEGIEMAPYGLLAAELGVPGLTYDAHNAEYLLQRRAFTTDVTDLRKLPRALYSLVQWWRLRHLERELCRKSTHILAVSEADRRALASLAPDATPRIMVLPNGVDTEYWSPGAVSDMEPALPPDSVVFDGTMDFRPNVDASLWFVKQVWPLIRQKKPDARFYIVGRNPAPQVLALAAPGVVVTGAVDDTRPYVAGADVYVVPMRMGGGVRLKFLQALSMGRAVVSTSMGAEGVDITGGRELLLAGSPLAFADAVISLLSDPDRRTRLGTAARRTALSRYAWPILLPTLDRIYPK